jgi:sugar (pentulose or hexulose) kinase
MTPPSAVFCRSGPRVRSRCADACGLEGVCFAFRDSLEALAQAGTTLDPGHRDRRRIASDYWLQALATVLDLPVDIPEAATSAPPSAPPGSA